MSKIRINELARELEVKPGRILDLLPELGFADKRTHSSSLDDDVANHVRRALGFEVAAEAAEAEQAAVAAPAAPVQADRAQEAEPKVAGAPSAPSPVARPAGEPEPAGRIESKAPAQAAPPVVRTPASNAPASRGEPLAGPEPARPVQPLRPPLAIGRPVVPSIPIPAGRPSAPPPSVPLPAIPPLSLTPQARAIPRPPSGPPTEPASPVGAGVPPATPAVKPGQILSGPRQPLPAEAGRPVVAPGRPAPPPPPPRPTPRVAAPSQPQAGAGRPIIGQPPPRPIVPPRPDLAARLTQARQAAPGQPTPRPGAPQARHGAMPGQPIYRGPVRPNMPVVRGPGMPGPGGLAGRPLRGRGLHPTAPLAPEPAAVPTDARRHQAKGAHKAREREVQEGKLLPVHTRRDEPVMAVNTEITIGEGITVKELAEKLGIKASLVIKKLVDRKIFATINQTLDVKLAEELAQSFGAASSHMSFEEEATWEVEMAEETGDQVGRAPVVTVMGHVDHGKTSLLDSIRSSDVAAHEAGGITQHIGAYQIHHNGKKVVFIDTPGHEAFTRMRARGARVTDIVVLVVAADDGVMPQTLEAIDHARAAKVPIIVAINKIDKPDAQVDRIKQQLSDRGLLAEDWGGDTVMVPVSAKARQNIELLLEMILLVTEMLNLKANPARPAVCTVLEAKLDRGRGPVATVLVRNGTLKVGDHFICGTVFSRVRAMVDDHGETAREAEPSSPVEVQGLESLPDVGDTLQVITDLAKARQIVDFREQKAREIALAKTNRLTLETFHQQLREGEMKELNLIIKADVGGSAEVLSESLQKLSTEKVRIKVIHKGVGAITETDVLLASASEAIIIGFSVRPERTAAQVAEQEGVDIRLHTIIYDLTQEIKKAMAGLLDPVVKEVYKGRAEVRNTFRISKVGTVAGCYVQDGLFVRNCDVRVLRDNVVVHTGKVEGLRRFKDDVSEVKSGFECGINIANFNDVKPGDVLEAFVTEKVLQGI